MIFISRELFLDQIHCFHMLRIIALSIIFSLSTLFSAKINSGGLALHMDELKPNFSESEILANKITDNLKDSANISNPDIVNMAATGYANLLEEGLIQEGSPLSIIDFSLPSTEKRLWIVDPQTGALLYHSLVSHGRNSGDLLAKKFSNVNSSFMSSLGFYITAETYQGKHGFSLRLNGIEEGFNDNARARNIVIHGADYANEGFIKTAGRLGRSLGCPALPMDLYKQIINTIKEGSCLFVYGEDPTYLSKSPVIKGLLKS